MDACVCIYHGHERYEQLLGMECYALGLTICHTPKQSVDAHRCLHLDAWPFTIIPIVFSNRRHAVTALESLNTCRHIESTDNT